MSTHIALTALTAILGASTVAVGAQTRETAPHHTAAATIRPAAAGTSDARGVQVSRAAKPPSSPTDESGIDRTFHPDYSQALTVDQMTAAWNREIDRVFETPITGGG
jgi:hypothetical protein